MTTLLEDVCALYERIQRDRSVPANPTVREYLTADGLRSDDAIRSHITAIERAIWRLSQAARYGAY
jgi:hypothetical protein